MSSIDSLCDALDEVAIARNVGMAHDKARAEYGLRKNVVTNFKEFNEINADYYIYHVSQTIGIGGNIPYYEAIGRASEIIEREYKRQGGNLMSAYKDANDGTNGGLRIILDVIAEHLKEESIERYIRNAFNQHVDPTSWSQKVEIIRQFIDRYGYPLRSAIDAANPERYAQNYDELIRAFMDGLKKSSKLYKNF